MQTPASTQMRTPIYMLKKLGERLNKCAAHFVMQLPETRLGNDHAGHIETAVIEQTSRIKTVAIQRNSVATSCCNREAMCFSSLLRQRTPYSCREAGFCVRKAVAVNPQNIYAI